MAIWCIHYGLDLYIYMCQLYHTMTKNIIHVFDEDRLCGSILNAFLRNGYMVRFRSLIVVKMLTISSYHEHINKLSPSFFRWHGYDWIFSDSLEFIWHVYIANTVEVRFSNYCKLTQKVSNQCINSLHWQSTKQRFAVLFQLLLKLMKY